ncbi:hypothetical protein LguiB_022163 [Lonicera macranthoides]
MGPPKAVRSISQQAFDEMVKENMDDLDMDPTEALRDAIETLTLQGVDLSGIATCIPGESTVTDNPVIQSLERLKELSSDWADRINEDGELGEVLGLLDKLTDLCRVEGLGNAAIATRNGGLELVCLICSKLSSGCSRGLVSALNTMASFLHDLQSTETFKNSGGPKMLVGILNDGTENVNVLNSGFSVVAAAATGNEVLKELFMDLKIEEIIAIILRKCGKLAIPSLYDAIRVLLTADDNRVVASQVYGYARKFAKIGIAESLVDSLREGLSSPSLVSASIALKSVAVNDEICRSVAEVGGIDAVLCCIDDSGEQGNTTVAKACCSLLSKLAGSDANKNAIVEKRGMDRLIKLSARFSDDPSVIQEVISIICTLSLRSPDNAACAVEAGAGDLAIQSMQKFPRAHLLQKNSCLMIRNLVVRNPENRSLLLNNGIEKIIRKAKENHQSCKAAATDALRDLGLDNYNS